jgi:hypothetical protein
VSVYLAIATVAAYLLTFFASGSTVIYYLLRRHVDVTDIDDVFIEEEEALPEMSEEDQAAEEAEESDAENNEAEEEAEDAEEGDDKDSE